MKKLYSDQFRVLLLDPDGDLWQSIGTSLAPYLDLYTSKSISEVEQNLHGTHPVNCILTRSSTWLEQVGKHLDSYRQTLEQVLKVLVLAPEEERPSVDELSRRCLDSYCLSDQPAEQILLWIRNVLLSKQDEDQQQAQVVARYASLLDAIKTVMIGVDEQGRVFEWNKGAAELFQIPSGQAHSSLLAELPIPWEPTTTQKLLDSRRLDEPSRFDDIPFNLPDGTTGILGITSSPLGNNAGLLIQAADITARQIQEQQNLQSQKLEAIGQLAAGIAHEINTPIQYVSDSLFFLQEAFEDIQKLVESKNELAQGLLQGPETVSVWRKADEEADWDYLITNVPQALMRINEGLARVSKIVSAMKEFSHPASAKWVWANINESLESTLIVSRSEYKEVAQLETLFADDLPRVLCEISELGQVFLNLIVNAAHAIREKFDKTGEMGQITVATNWIETEQQVEIVICDTGAGIEQSNLNKIYEPFFTTKPVGQGTGQGLCIARRIVVEKHKGSIDCRSKIGEGTTFVIRLPIKQQSEEKTAVSTNEKIK